MADPIDFELWQRLDEALDDYDEIATHSVLDEATTARVLAGRAVAVVIAARACLHAHDEPAADDGAAEPDRAADYAARVRHTLQTGLRDSNADAHLVAAVWSVAGELAQLGELVRVGKVETEAAAGAPAIEVRMPLPQGSYQTTCRDCTMIGGTLSCLCLDKNGHLQPTRLEVPPEIARAPAPGVISNHNGVLVIAAV